MFYFRFLDLTHLTAETLDPCTSLPLFPQILLLVPGIHHSTGLPWEIFVQFPHISDTTQYLSFSVRLSIRPTRSIHVVTNGRLTFTRLNNIPVCMYVPHIFFSPSPTHRHLGCFRILATVPRMLQWTWGCRYLFHILFSCPLDRSPEVGLLDHRVVQLCKIFEDLPYSFSQWLYQFTFYQ